MFGEKNHETGSLGSVLSCDRRWLNNIRESNPTGGKGENQPLKNKGSIWLNGEIGLMLRTLSIIFQAAPAKS